MILISAEFHPALAGNVHTVQLIRKRLFLLAGEANPLRQIRDLLFHLADGGFQSLAPLVREGAVPIRRLMDAAVDLCQLFLGK